MTDILMPKLSDSMEQGTIISWLKTTGDQVEVGDELIEIETDKSTAPYQAEISGVLEVLVPVGTTVSVGEPIARIGSAAPAAASGQSDAPQHDQAAEANGADGRSEDTSPRQVIASRTPVPQANGAGAPSNTARVTPLARRVAAAHGVILENVRGTGPLGRVTRADVLKAAGVEAQAPSALPQATSPAAVMVQQPTTVQAPTPGARRQELTRLQQLVVRRMAESKSTIPHFQVQTEVDMGAVITLRQELKTAAPDTHPVPSVNDLIVKAAAVALRDHPLANASYRDGAFELHEDINIGVAVAADGALVVPVIHNADIKSLSQIGNEARRLAAAVREQTIAPPDLSGGTFTVSNLGMFGMTAITPVINPPEAAILGVGATRPTLARVDGEIVERSMLTLTLSCDHRVLYGADAARFLAEIRDLLQAPLRLTL